MEIIEPVGTFFGMIILYPVMMLLMPTLMGLISLFFSPFSWIYAGIIGILFAIQIIIPNNTRIITVAALSLGIIMMWISLFISYQRASPAYDDLVHPMAHGGFPVRVFDYPPSVMGSDVPPIDTWGLFYLNLGFWVAIGAGIAMVLCKHLNNKVSFKLFIASVAISLYGLGYLSLEFD
jgi:hypothetical protein